MEKLRCYLKNVDSWGFLCGMVLLTASLKMAYTMQDIANIVYILTLFLSVLFLGILLFKRIKELKRVFKNVLEKIFALTVLFFMISILVNFNTQFLKNVRALIVGVIFFFILFEYSEGRKREFIEKQLHKFNMIIIVSTFIYGIIMCLFLFFYGTIWFTNFSGNVFDVGWYAERIIGIYGNGNSAGTSCFISLAISVIEIVFQREKNCRINKIVYINIVVQLIGVLVSASRSSFVAVIVFGFIVVYALFYKKRGKVLKSAIKSIVCVSAGTVVLLVASSHIMDIPRIQLKSNYWIDIRERTITKIEKDTTDSTNNNAISIAYRFESGKQYQDNLGEQVEKTVESGTVESGTVENEVGESAIDLNQYSSGRIDIWKSALEVWKKHPIWGAGLYGLENNMRYETDFFRNYEEDKIELIYQNYFSMHNDFIQAFVSGGLIGGILLIGLIAVLLYKSLIKYLRLSNQADKLKVGCLLAFIVGMLCMSMFLYIFYFDAISTGGVFWFYFGVMYYYLKENELLKVEKDNKEDQVNKNSRKK